MADQQRRTDGDLQNTSPSKRLLSVVNRETVSRCAPAYVLCGPLRGGTTLTRILLAQHPQVHAPGESDFYFDGLEGSLDDADTPQGRAALREAMRLSRISRAQEISDPAGSTVREMLADLVEQQRPETGGLLLTLHRHFDLAAEAFPNAVFIRLRRDPRDVAISAMKMGWSGNPYFGVRCWLDAERSWVRASAMLPRERVVEISFEDLTRDPEAELRRVVDRMGLAFDRRVLTTTGSTYSPPHPGRIEAWRGTLSPSEVAEINAAVSDVGANSGYDLTPAKPPSVLRHAYLVLEDKLRRQRHNIEIYGVRHWLEHRLARRFGSQQQRERILRERQRITEQYLK